MEKTNVIVGGSNVNGNIGSCEIKSDNFSTSSWRTQTVAVNSCTGEIVSSKEYFDVGVIYFPAIIIIIVWAIKKILIED